MRADLRNTAGLETAHGRGDALRRPARERQTILGAAIRLGGMPARRDFDRLQTRPDHHPPARVQRLTPRARVCYDPPLFGTLRAVKSLGEPLAQLVEHRPFKAGVLGSRPRRLTKFFSASEVGGKVKCISSLGPGSRASGW